MRRAIAVALGTGAFISSAAALSLSGTENSNKDVDRTEYEISLQRIAALKPVALTRCDVLAAAEKELCRTEAEAREMVRTAEVEQQFRRTETSARALQRARIDARYQVERARCGTLAGAKRDRCLIRAHAARGRALLEAASPYEVRF
jgi:hypothetical protein